MVMVCIWSSLRSGMFWNKAYRIIWRLRCTIFFFIFYAYTIFVYTQPAADPLVLPLLRREPFIISSLATFNVNNYTCYNSDFQILPTFLPTISVLSSILHFFFFSIFNYSFEKRPTCNYIFLWHVKREPHFRCIILIVYFSGFRMMTLRKITNFYSCSSIPCIVIYASCINYSSLNSCCFCKRSSPVLGRGG